MTEPLVSIIITSYNREEFIGKAIESALIQDYPNLEIIISDNHSTDNSDAVIKKYTHDKRIKYFVNDTNIGMVPNFTLATTQRAQGKYITYLSSDDYLCKNDFISGALNLINKYPDIIFVAGKNSTLYNGSNELFNDPSDYKFQQEFMYGKDVFKLFPRWLSPGWGAVLMDREKLIQTKIFESKAQSLDHEANLKLMLQGNVAFIKQPSYVFRKHASNASRFMTYETQVNNLDFIENAYSYARGLKTGINLEAWRLNVYRSYLDRNSAVLLKSKEEFNQLLVHVKNDKKIRLNLFTAPKLIINCFIYKNYTNLRFLLKHFFPKKYKSIKRLMS
jgi:glycosyltransferase involved in cell wall biosynthesis